MAIRDCSIVILAHNSVEFTERCLSSVLGATDHPRELFLVDNGSSDSTPALFEQAQIQAREAGISCFAWRNEENKGCSVARNEAWAKTTSTYTMFMDNDTAVCTRDWLGRLTQAMDDDPSLGILGVKLIYPYEPHPIQCAGVGISPLGRIAFRGRGKPRHDERFCEVRSVNALISACWIMRTELREKAGYLDELFHPVQYEDLDLCLRARESGYDVAYTPQVEVYHFEGITTASFGQTEYQRNIARNSLKFRERWHDVIRTFEDELPADEYRWLGREELGLKPVLDLAYCD
ncbi:MAG: glycosyltransferase family 2 protein [Lentisphaerae bacterium]|jgi:O-antigen biosynthesis protein|nr:glycosyltransferase family 2 protein [Lentisphaerota bacterium]MBT4821696.1 glycosyltransferase family 2 protein [Lentisphaerota bacterium]MBT5608144.1 glycosyltransferase family 2 protein [Lentisphaerota bacterium]MBT7060579.1 glycosyltransferase family 2 protein [Lentisphaerota bacterium]MBT7847678.1 glycosyltransferase family 2 protein [Lentisphaerota bacterium]